jgi:hypothetical protein
MGNADASALKVAWRGRLNRSDEALALLRTKCPSNVHAGNCPVISTRNPYLLHVPADFLVAGVTHNFTVQVVNFSDIPP